MTDTTSTTMATETEAAEGAPRGVANVLQSELTEEGRYIPFSGGCMGWFENAGVLKCELGNNYLFYTVMGSDKVRTKQFQRWGDKFNRRGQRERFKRMTGVSLMTGRNPARGTTRDVSRHGVRVQFLTEIKLQKGDSVQMKLHESETSDKALLDVNAQVVWAERIGKIRPVWNLGLTFAALTPEQEAAIQPLLQDG